MSMNHKISFLFISIVKLSLEKSLTNENVHNYCNEPQGNLVCDCKFGYTGQYCETEIDWCNERIVEVAGNITVNEACSTHGTCSSIPTGGATCFCNQGFAGLLCQTVDNVHEALSQRCARVATNQTIAHNITTGCPHNYRCMLDNLDCGFRPCPYPVGWCTPKEKAGKIFKYHQLLKYHETEAARKIEAPCNGRGTPTCNCVYEYNGDRCEYAISTSTETTTTTAMPTTATTSTPIPTTTTTSKPVPTTTTPMPTTTTTTTPMSTRATPMPTTTTPMPTTTTTMPTTTTTTTPMPTTTTTTTPMPTTTTTTTPMPTTTTTTTTMPTTTTPMPTTTTTTTPMPTTTTAMPTTTTTTTPMLTTTTTTTPMPTTTITSTQRPTTSTPMPTTTIPMPTTTTTTTPMPTTTTTTTPMPTTTTTSTPMPTTTTTTTPMPTTTTSTPTPTTTTPIPTTTTTMTTTTTLDPNAPRANCAEWRLAGYDATGYYNIYVYDDTNRTLIRSVRCDMTTEGGGWTVIQRRTSGSVDFFRSWEDYRTGFGDNSNFWIGNDFIHSLTNQIELLSLRIDFQDCVMQNYFAKYSNFRVGRASENYGLSVSGYDNSSTAGDSLGYGGGGSFYQNGQEFGTCGDGEGHDNYGGQCPCAYHGGWWFNRCGVSNLNGLYYSGCYYSATYDNGIFWYTIRAIQYSLKFTEMKIRPRDFITPPK